MDNKNKNKNQKPLMFYYMASLIVLIILNFTLFPLLTKPTVEEVSYSAFIKYLDEGKITRAEITDTQIYFTLKDGKEETQTEEKDETLDILSPNNKKETVKVANLIPDLKLTDRLIEKNIDFGKVQPKELSPIMKFVFNWILPIFFFILIGQLISKLLFSKISGKNSMSFGQTDAKVYVPSESGISFNDVAGQDEAKEALSEIVDFLHDPAKYTKVGAVMPKGALLVGPPGTGKTLLARAVAGEANVPFFSIAGSEFVEMFVGRGAARVRDLFKQANEKAPCIVFIDEIDTIGKKRGGSVNGNDEREQTLNQLLTEMDGFDGGKGVVILAATNRPDSLDEALLRPGRFDRRVPVELPDLKGREAILQVHSKKVSIADDIDYNLVARATAGASGAELANIINEAALKAVREGRDMVLQADLEESVEVVIAGYQRKNSVISDYEKKVIAYHEIGHALVAALQTESAPVHKITIIPRTSGALGYTMQIAEDEKVLMTREEAFNKITTFTGGRAAEELIFKTPTSGASNDIEQATKLAKAMVTRYGMSPEFGMVALENVSNQYLGGDSALACSPETSTKIDIEVQKIINSAYEKAAGILQENVNSLHKLSEFLLKEETITGEQFMEILNKERNITTPKKDDNDDAHGTVEIIETDEDSM